MEKETRISLLARIARSPVSPATGTERPFSILSLSAASYGSRPSRDATVPTGFDPVAAALFEAIVEGAFLVATADGVFDAEERRAFERIVHTAGGGTVPPKHITALLEELGERLRQDGLDGRIRAVAAAVTRKEHARELLRVAALLAQTSGDVSVVERDVLAKLAAACALEGSEVDDSLREVRNAIASSATE